MAGILVRIGCSVDISRSLNEEIHRISAGQKGDCVVYGRTGTFCVIRDGNDAIASIGYVGQIGDSSVEQTLREILSSFQESEIVNLKMKLIGQFLLLIKKDRNIFIFSDFFGGRNIFYSEDEIIISSSFSQIEDLLQTNSSDLDVYKVFEYLAVKHILYPAWLGSSTEHKRIKWLLPYEFLAINMAKSSLRIGSIVYSIDNEKQSDCSLLSSNLLSTLRSIISRKEFSDSPVAASLTGGRDSWLVAIVAAEQYCNMHFRTAASPTARSSLKDQKVAAKIARIQGIQHDIYRFQPGRDEARFRELTEAFSPSFNHSITPLIDSAERYALGFGGVFGTELFMPIIWNSIDDYIQAGVERAMQALHAEEGFWQYFRELLYSEFQKIKDHFRLSHSNDRDYIRLFNLLDTARYASFILSAFNRLGYQIEPYGSYAVLDLALKVAPSLWGNHKSLGGDALVQKSAMATLSPRLSRLMTYRAFRPMSPLAISSSPLYLIGFSLHVVNWVIERLHEIKEKSVRTDLKDGYYISNGWEKQFLHRTVEIYGLSITTEKIG